jgi:hypothetical protein
VTLKTIFLYTPMLFVAAYDRCVLTKLEELKEGMNELRKVQSYLVAKIDQILNSNGGGSIQELPREIVFPIRSLRELDAFELRMQDSNLLQLVVRQLCRSLLKFSQRIVLNR